MRGNPDNGMSGSWVQLRLEEQSVCTFTVCGTLHVIDTYEEESSDVLKGTVKFSAVGVDGK